MRGFKHQLCCPSRSAVIPTLIVGAVLFGSSPDAIGSVISLVSDEGAEFSRAAQPEFDPAVLQGVPIDFKFFALRTQGPPEDEAVEKALRKLQDTISRNESISPGNESVILKRPSLYAAMGGIDPAERIPEEWYAAVTDRREIVKQVVQSVGRIEVYHLDEEERDPAAVGFIAGTGFVVAPGVIMTNRHVAEIFTETNDLTFPFKKSRRAMHSPLVYINFAGIYGEEQRLFRIDKVLYVAPKTELDVALLHIQQKPEGGEPLPLRLQNVKPSESTSNRRVFACGYPTQDNDSGTRANSFFRTLKVKRLSFGELLGDELFYDGNFRLFHNCTTLGGSSGSPLIDLETGTVWGLHFDGWWTDPEGNKAEPMWRICAIPEVRRILGPAATKPTDVVPAQPTGNIPRSRPVLRLGPDNIAEGQAFPSRWFKPSSEELANLRRIIPSVGLVEGAAGTVETTPLATAFMFLPGIAVTTSLAPAIPQELVISFSPERAQEQSRKFRGKVLFQSEQYNIAFLEVEAAEGQVLPPPLPLQIDDPGKTIVGRPAFLIGYTFQDTWIPSEVFTAVFPPPYGNKRLSLGKIMSAGSDSKKFKGSIEHDCNTAAGSGGAPLISLATGKVLGVHMGGLYLLANYATPIWKLLQIPGISQLLKDRGFIDSSR